MERAFPDWFTGQYAQQYFERNLLPLRGAPRLRFLQVGAYAGDASRWLASNILTGPGSLLVDVDTWEGTQAEGVHRRIDFGAVRCFYDSLKPVNVEVFEGTSDMFFAEDRGLFDFVYVDGDHHPGQVLRDAVNAERVLRDGGLLAFDDYLWSNPEVPGLVPQLAVDGFFRCYRDTLEVVDTGRQVWFRKLPRRVRG